MIKLSRALGIGTDFLQGLNYAAQIGGATIEDVDKGLNRLTKNLGDAQDGLSTAKRAFKDLTLEFKTSEGRLKTVEEIIPEIADRFATMTDTTKRNQLAQNLLGKAGKRLINTLSVGSKGLAEMTKQARRLGFIQEKKALKNSEDFNDEMLRTKVVLLAVRNQIAKRLLPAITRNLRIFTQWIRQGNNMQIMLQRLKVAAMAAGAALAVIGSAKLVSAATVLVGAVGKMIQAMRLLGLAAIRTKIKILAIPLIIIAILAVIEDLYSFVQGKDTVTGRLLGDRKDTEVFRAALKNLFDAIMELVKEIKPVVVDIVKAMGPLLKESTQEFLKLLKEVLPILKPIIKWILIIIIAISWLATKILIWLIKRLKDVFRWIGKIAKLVAGGVVDAFKAMGRAAVAVWGAIKIAAFAVIDGIKTAWTTMGRVLVFVWDLTVSALKKIWDGFKRAVLAVINAIKAAFKAVIGGILVAWNKVIAAIRKVIRFTEKAFNKVKSILGLQKETLELEQFTRPAAAPTAGTVGRLGAVGSISQNVSVSGVTVQVTGSVDMTAPEMSERIEAGAKRALQKAVTSAMKDRKPTVSPAPVPT